MIFFLKLLSFFVKLLKWFSFLLKLRNFVATLILYGVSNLEFVGYGITYFLTDFPHVLIYFFTLPWDIILSNYYASFLLLVLALCVCHVLPIYYYYPVIRHALMNYNKTARIPLPPHIIPLVVITYSYWLVCCDVPLVFFFAAISAVFLFSW